jgi:hypothetical protein
VGSQNNFLTRRILHGTDPYYDAKGERKTIGFLSLSDFNEGIPWDLPNDPICDIELLPSDGGNYEKEILYQC